MLVSFTAYGVHSFHNVYTESEIRDKLKENSGKEYEMISLTTNMDEVKGDKRLVKEFGRALDKESENIISYWITGTNQLGTTDFITELESKESMKLGDALKKLWGSARISIDINEGNTVIKDKSKPLSDLIKDYNVELNVDINSSKDVLNYGKDSETQRLVETQKAIQQQIPNAKKVNIYVSYSDGNEEFDQFSEYNNIVNISIDTTTKKSEIIKRLEESWYTRG